MSAEPTVAIGARPSNRVAGLIALTKPRIIELLLVTTVPPMVLAARGWPGWRPIAATLIGGTLCAAGANALNCYVDRDIDARMARTRRRPLPRSSIAPDEALWFGFGLGMTGFIWLALTTNLVAASLATAALVFYVVVYSRLLKRTTDQNIVIGGAAGAAPVLVGWAAVDGVPALPAWILFLVVFYWTPPHFWSLAIRYRDDYAAGGVPMLPVVKGMIPTTTQIVAYSLLTAVASLLLIPGAGMGPVYSIGATCLGAWLIVEAWKVHVDPRRAMVLFRRSTFYLAALFATVALDVLLAR